MKTIHRMFLFQDPGISLKERLDLCHFPSRLSEEVKNRMSIRENLEEQAYLDFKVCRSSMLLLNLVYSRISPFQYMHLSLSCHNSKNIL